ncbi:SMP-30/gluconolactonase/LRE family protein [Klebsiella variicola]
MATSRRDLLKIGGLATASLLVSQKSFAAWAPSERYPDPRIVAVDDSFRRYMLASAKVERIASGFRWAEGPVRFGDMRMLLWSDIPNNAIMRWDEISGETSVFRYPANYSNGHARDRQGRLISCEHDTRRITRTEYDGSVTVLADSYQGKRLNSPNDIVVKSDGTIWFTDPPFGISGFYEGHKATPELPQNVYCLEPESRKLSVVLGDIKGPNGLCFSPDEKTLYVVESRATPNRLILAWDVEGNTLKNKRVYLDCGNGTADGIACDADGNLWCGWGSGNEELDGVRIFNPQGKHIGTIQLPERCANLCFGGEQHNRLFMASSTSIYSLYVNAQGAKLV